MDVSNISVNVHSSICIDASKKIYIDPFEIENKTCDADYIFVTHDHYDHYSPKDISKIIKNDTKIIIPQAMEKKVKKEFPEAELITVVPGQDYETQDLSFETVAAYNVMKTFHSRKAGWVGYVINIDGKKTYVAGDTDLIKEAEQVKCDIALVPIGGFYTMNYKEAAKLINQLRPAYAIPVHYGKLAGKPEDGENFTNLVDSDIKVEIKLQF